MMNATLPALVDVSQRLADRVQAVGSPWPARVVSWIDLVELCRELDEGLVLGEQVTSEALDLHRTILNIAISNGEPLTDQIRRADADISLSGHDLPTLEASLELLRIFYRTHHPDCSPVEVQSARNRIFNAAA